MLMLVFVWLFGILVHNTRISMRACHLLISMFCYNFVFLYISIVFSYNDFVVFRPNWNPMEMNVNELQLSICIFVPSPLSISWRMHANQSTVFPIIIFNVSIFFFSVCAYCSLKCNNRLMDNGLWFGLFSIQRTLYSDGILRIYTIINCQSVISNSQWASQWIFQICREKNCNVATVLPQPLHMST